MTDPPVDGGGAVAVEPTGIGLLLVLGLAFSSLAILRGLLRKGFLDYGRRLGPTEPPLWGVGEIAAIAGLYFFSSIGVGGLLLLVMHPGGPLDPRERVVTLFLTLVLSWAPPMAAILYVVRRNLGQPLTTLGFRRVPWVAFPGCVLLYALVLFPLGLASTLWQLALREAGVEVLEQDLLGIFRDSAGRGDVLSFVLLGASAVIVAPVCEEIFFRGFLFGALRERAGPIAAAVISSAIFTAVHVSLSATAMVFFLALVLCGLYARTGSIYPGIAFHALFNSATLAKATYDAFNSTA